MRLLHGVEHFGHFNLGNYVESVVGHKLLLVGVAGRESESGVGPPAGRDPEPRGPDRIGSRAGVGKQRIERRRGRSGGEPPARHSSSPGPRWSRGASAGADPPGGFQYGRRSAGRGGCGRGHRDVLAAGETEGGNSAGVAIGGGGEPSERAAEGDDSIMVRTRERAGSAAGRREPAARAVAAAGAAADLRGCKASSTRPVISSTIFSMAASSATVTAARTCSASTTATNGARRLCGAGRPVAGSGSRGPRLARSLAAARPAA